MYRYTAVGSPLLDRSNTIERWLRNDFRVFRSVGRCINIAVDLKIAAVLVVVVTAGNNPNQLTVN
jgi:hypothetical protein